MTYGDIYSLFTSGNPKIKPFIQDYRPNGESTLIIWFNNAMAMLIHYNCDSDRFELVE